MPGPMCRPEVPDEIDPAPRIIRIIAAAFLSGTPGRPSIETPQGRMIEQAKILEGTPADPAYRLKRWAMVATAERRVKRAPRTRGIIDLEPVTRPPTAEEKAARQQLIESGDLPPDEE